jgi:hypothetical protein
MSERLKTLNERFNSFLNYENKSTILSLKEGMEEQDPTLLSYTAVFIEDPAEIKKLESIANQAIDTVVPKNAIDNTVWNFPSDYHMTVKLGRLALSRRMNADPDVDSEVILEVIGIGVSNDAIALLVTGYMSKNIRQHITLAFKTTPSDSNSIPNRNWYKLKKSFPLKGVIREV